MRNLTKRIPWGGSETILPRNVGLCPQRQEQIELFCEQLIVILEPCPASALLRQIERLHERRMAG